MTVTDLLAEGRRQIDGRAGTCASCADFERLVPVHLPHLGPGLVGVRPVCSLCAGLLTRAGLADRPRSGANSSKHWDAA